MLLLKLYFLGNFVIGIPVYFVICCSLVELGVLEDGVSSAQSNAHTVKECDDKLGAESRNADADADTDADCVCLGQEPCHTGEEPFKIGADSKCLSEKVSPGVQSLLLRRKKPYNCQSSTKLRPSTRSVLQRHNSHKERATFKCKICNESFFEKETLAVHVLVHSGTLSFSSWSKAVRM